MANPYPGIFSLASFNALEYFIILLNKSTVISVKIILF